MPRTVSCRERAQPILDRGSRQRAEPHARDVDRPGRKDERSAAELRCDDVDDGRLRRGADDVGPSRRLQEGLVTGSGADLADGLAHRCGRGVEIARGRRIRDAGTRARLELAQRLACAGEPLGEPGVVLAAQPLEVDVIQRERLAQPPRPRAFQREHGFLRLTRASRRVRGVEGERLGGLEPKLPARRAALRLVELLQCRDAMGVRLARLGPRAALCGPEAPRRRGRDARARRGRVDRRREPRRGRFFVGCVAVELEAVGEGLGDEEVDGLTSDRCEQPACLVEVGAIAAARAVAQVQRAPE